MSECIGNPLLPWASVGRQRSHLPQRCKWDGAERNVPATLLGVQKEERRALGTSHFGEVNHGCEEVLVAQLTSATNKCIVDPGTGFGFFPPRYFQGLIELGLHGLEGIPDSASFSPLTTGRG